MRSVNSTAALSSSGYSKRPSRKSGHFCTGGRLSRVKVSTWAERPSGGLAMIPSREHLPRNDDLLDLGGALIDAQRPDIPVQPLDDVAAANAVAAVKLHRLVLQPLRVLGRKQYRLGGFVRHTCCAG